jgi:GAF domain-containing protein
MFEQIRPQTLAAIQTHLAQLAELQPELQDPARPAGSHWAALRQEIESLAEEVTEMATLYHGSQAIAQAISERQIFEALFTQMRLIEPQEISAYYYQSVSGEPIWLELTAQWQATGKPSLPLGSRLYLPETAEARWLTVPEAIFIEDVAGDQRLSAAERQAFATRAVGAVAIFPLVTSGYAIGVMRVYFANPTSLALTTKRFCQAMVEQASVLLANRQLIQEATYRTVQIQTAADVARPAIAFLDVNALLDSMAKLIRERFELYYVGVFLVDETKTYAVLRAGTGEAGRIQLENNHRLKIGGESMIGWCLAHLTPRIALDVGREAVHFQNPHLPHTRSEVALPLIYQNEAIGALTLQSVEPAAFSQADILFLQMMADQLANALESARSYEMAQQEIAERKRVEKEILQRNNELAAINRVTEAVTSTLDFQRILAAIAREMALIFDTRTCGIALLNEAQSSLKVIAHFSLEADAPDATGVVIPIEGNPSSMFVIETGQSIIVSDAQNNPMLAPIQPLMRQRHTQSLLIVPLKVRGEVIGTIGLDTAQVEREFTKSDIELAETIAGQVAGTIENARLFEQTQAALAERERAETALRASVELEELLAMASQTFVNLTSDRIDQGVNHTLQKVGQFFQADRAYIFLLSLDESGLSQSHAWDRPGLAPQPENLQTIPAELIPWGLERVRNREIIAVSHLADLPAAAKLEKDLLDGQQVQSLVMIPLAYGGKAIGFARFDLLDRTRNWSDEEIRVFKLLGEVLSNALERKNSGRALQEAFARTQSLYRISNALATNSDKQAVFEIVLDEYLRLLKLSRGSLVLFDRNELRCTVQAMYVDGTVTHPQLSLSIRQSLICQQMIEQPEIMVIDDVRSHPLSQGQPMVAADTTAMVLIPLLVQGAAAGMIRVEAVRPGHHFRQSDLEMGRVIADQLTIWLENRQLLEETQHRSKLLETSAEISRTASSILDVDQLINESVNLIRDKFDFYYVGLFLVDPAKKWAVLRAGTGPAGQVQLDKGHRLEIGGDSMIGWSIANHTARIALDVGEDAVHFENPDLPDTRSEMALPLISRDEVIGAVTVQSTKPGAFSPEDITLLQTMADQLANAIQNARLFEEASQAREEAEERLQETIALQQLSQALSGTLQVQEILDIFFRACTRVIGFEYVIFSQVDKAQARIKAIAGVGVSEDNIKRANHSLSSHDIMADLIRTGQTELITGWDERFDRQNFEAEGHKDWVRLFIPVTLRRENVGVVEAGFKSRHKQISDDQISLLRAFIDQTVLALDNAQRYEASQRTARREALIKEITTRVRASTDMDTILQTTAKELGEAINGKRAYVQLLAPIQSNERENDG